MPSLTLYRLVVAVLAVSGVAQMPIFKRYYIADIPGLGWTADFIFTHRLHYLAAAALLFWLARRIVLSGASSIGEGRLALLLALIATGVPRMLKNLPDVSFSPTATMLIDWTHLGAAMALGLTALAMVFKRHPHTSRR
ncbi:MAG: FeS-binding protein [Desulfovibrio sp.]|nr:FeS-binding protein [Desulfovibrio sp.]MBI4958390.1 FeS-binding protein [Desulfovibrio sp.]